MKNLQLESGVLNLIAKKFLFNFIQIPHTSRLGFVMAYYKNIKLFFQKEMEKWKVLSPNLHSCKLIMNQSVLEISWPCFDSTRYINNLNHGEK